MRGMMIIFSLGEQFYFMNRHHLITYGVNEFILLYGDFLIFFSDPLRKLFVCQWRKRKFLLKIFVLKRKKRKTSNR